MAEGGEFEMGGFDRQGDDDYGNVDESNLGGDDDETSFQEEVGTGTTELPSEIPAWASGDEYPLGWKEEEIASRTETDRRVAEFDVERRGKGFTHTRARLEFQSKKNGTLYVKWGKNWVRLTADRNPHKFL